MEHTATERIASNLRSELGRLRVSRRELAQLTGWTTSTTNRRVNGEYPIPIDDLQLIAQKIDVPLTVLLDGVEGIPEAAAATPARPRRAAVAS